MKNFMRLFLPIFALALLTACGSKTAGEKVEAKEASGEAATASASAAKYVVNTDKSNIIWTGSKATGTHQGTMKVATGSLAVKDGNIESGNFTLDMNSIAVTDLKAGEGKEDLEGHLKAGDFFETGKYPTGSFTITKVESASGDASITHNITGDLKLKDTTKSVTLPANVAMVGNTITAVTPAFKINRTEWGIQYASGLIGTAKDKIINDDISLVINLVASK